ncbi:uncharacterized protein ACB058_001242 [Synchiropus picturatus]
MTDNGHKLYLFYPHCQCESAFYGEGKGLMLAASCFRQTEQIMSRTEALLLLLLAVASTRSCNTTIHQQVKNFTSHQLATIPLSADDSSTTTLLLQDNLIALNDTDQLALKGFSNLTELHLDGNRITRISARFFAVVPRLRVLTLSRNQISSLDPGSFSSLKDLEELDLSHNQLTSVPATIFDGLTHLKVRLQIPHISLRPTHIELGNPAIVSCCLHCLHSFRNLKCSILDCHFLTLPFRCSFHLRCFYLVNLQENPWNCSSALSNISTAIKAEGVLVVSGQTDKCASSEWMTEQNTTKAVNVQAKDASAAPTTATDNPTSDLPDPSTALTTITASEAKNQSRSTDSGSVTGTTSSTSSSTTSNGTNSSTGTSRRTSSGTSRGTSSGTKTSRGTSGKSSTSLSTSRITGSSSIREAHFLPAVLLDKTTARSNTWKFTVGVIVAAVVTSTIILCAIKGPSLYMLFHNYRHRRLDQDDDGDSQTTVFSRTGSRVDQMTFTFERITKQEEDDEEDVYYEDPFMMRDDRLDTDFTTFRFQN